MTILERISHIAWRILLRYPSVEFAKNLEQANRNASTGEKTDRAAEYIEQRISALERDNQNIIADLVKQKADNDDKNRQIGVSVQANRINLIIGAIAAGSLVVSIYAIRLTRESIIAANRPWLYIYNVKITKPLHFDESGAVLTVEFQTKNVGHSPAITVSVHGRLYTREEKFNFTATEASKECNKLRSEEVNFRSLGVTVFPDEPSPFPDWFRLSIGDVKIMTDPNERGHHTVMLTGCIDYLFEGDDDHHQTEFVYELAGPLQRDGFVPLKLDGTDIPEGGLSLAINPELGGKAD